MLPPHHKSTPCAPHSRILITAAIGSVVFLSGCSIFPDRVDTIETSSTPESVTPLAIDAPDPVDIDPPQWVVVTPENLDSVMGDLKSQGREEVLIALTPEQYQSLSMDLAEIREYINNQRAILIRYQEYYEADRPTTNTTQ